MHFAYQRIRSNGRDCSVEEISSLQVSPIEEWRDWLNKNCKTESFRAGELYEKRHRATAVQKGRVFMPCPYTLFTLTISHCFYINTENQ
jgi:hypothetical protein